MTSGHDFKRLARPRRRGPTTEVPNWRALHALLAKRVIARFVRVGRARPVAISLVLGQHQRNEELPMNPGHPACRKYAETNYCRESWQLHLAELCLRPESHWHKCDYNRFCALVPVVHHGRCLAAIKLACPASRSETDFARQVEFLDVLVRDFVAAEADFLERLPDVAPVPGESDAPRTHRSRRTAHPQILRALRYIEDHLSDASLTVGVVAREMGVHPNYLSHLFVDHVGLRMTRFIVARRIELAKTLLATTALQVKRIARDTGHANPRWFSHVFTDLTGLTPSAYRKKSHTT